MLKIDYSQSLIQLSQQQIDEYGPLVREAMEKLENGTGKGSDFLGWLHLASGISSKLVRDIKRTAKILRETCDVVVVAGIGGSYLGSRAVIEALSGCFANLNPGRNPIVVYAGHNISEDYLYDLTRFLRDKKFGIINISKSGTTTETALAFRILKKQCEKQRGKEVARKVIVAVTDAERGVARRCAVKEGYKTFVIPDNVGGRFSILTPVGLLPIAVAGFDIDQIIYGAAQMEKMTDLSRPFSENPAAIYAALRHALYKSGKKIEILANYLPKFHFLAEWWKQLYGESEGKEGMGIFPVSVDFTTDLHSMGQWIQQGERSIFETVISVEHTSRNTIIPFDEENMDGLNFMAGEHVDHVNKMAELGTRLAHVDGGVPNLRISLYKLDEYNIGELVYFFEKACGISGYLLGVNPFDQPGVEEYKRNMFALLGKPGYETETEAVRKRLGIQ